MLVLACCRFPLMTMPKPLLLLLPRNSEAILWPSRRVCSCAWVRGEAYSFGQRTVAWGSHTAAELEHAGNVQVLLWCGCVSLWCQLYNNNREYAR